MSNKVIEIPEAYLPEIGDLPGDLKRIAEAVDEIWHGQGVRIAILLSQLFPGIPLYMHNINTLIRKIRDDGMREEYDLGETTAKELAIKNRLSTRRVEDILSQSPSQKELKRKQMNMFDR